MTPRIVTFIKIQHHFAIHNISCFEIKIATAAVGCFAISTALITAILWKPLKRLQSTGEMGKDRSSDIIGHSFNLSSDISRTVSGEQKYSGINWRVEPAKDLTDAAMSAGTHVEVTAVSVGVFFVKPV